MEMAATIQTLDWNLNFTDDTFIIFFLAPFLVLSSISAVTAVVGVHSIKKDSSVLQFFEQSS